ncbi:DegV domain-containing protein [Streptococcus constellatus]|uniref:DegV family protein n=1 Tax=Streptococcus TaxID=1301 RepID=UPI000232958C|nr:MULTISPECIES: DegV family protein [Streptococcus]EHG14446.1 DegV domain-containing protein [Streptococcus intermedius F0395]MBW3452644.1 DegV family protein [Streptococcus constellatus]OFP93631.1 fatty acid-binding protein DegV [Streptococcus sp. HMSC067A03]RID95916.1 DegV domain-containing protein [Streptococcus constellatus]VEE81796.1 DegV family protein [Streptococcus milleri]
MTWKIVADSGCDYRTIENLAVDTLFESVPLTIQVGNEIFIDNAQLNIDNMMKKMYATSSASKSACPSPDDYMKAFDGASNIFVVTITGTLSGSHNSAQVAKKLYLEEHPDVNIHIIDTLSAGGENDLIIKKLNFLIGQGLSYEEVVTEITAYQTKTKLLFVLAKVDNLVKNGRLSKLVGAVVGLLNIRMVGEASQDGKLELLQKARGAKKSLIAAFDELIKAGYVGGQIIIAHRNNLKFCQQFSEMVREKFPQAVIEVIPTSGLCSFYAEENGLLIGYEIQ